MERLKRRALQQCTVELVKKMNPDTLRPYLAGKRLLTRDEQERLGLPTMITADKNLFILQTLPSKGRDSFDLFVDCLQDTAEEVPAHLELVHQLLDNLSKLMEPDN